MLQPWSYLGGDVIVNLNGSGSPIRDEIYAGGMHLATYTNSTTYFAHMDWLGTQRVQSVPSGAVDNSSTSGPWGELLSNPAGETTVQFTGDDHDAETNLEHTWFRKYASWQGRWLSPDPLGGDIGEPQSLNRYVYALDNPLRYIDPHGLSICEWLDEVNGNTFDFHPDSQAECEGNGGTFINTDTTVTVNAGSDGIDVVTFSGGAVGGGTRASAGQLSYLNCVKKGTDTFNLQEALKAVSGGRLGTSWLSGAFLGSSASALIDIGQSLGKSETGQAISTAAGEALGDVSGPAAAAAAPNVPNVAVTATAAVAASVETPTSSIAAQGVVSVSGTIPLNAAATAGARALGILGVVKIPVDLTAAGFSGLVCLVGR